MDSVLSVKQRFGIIGDNPKLNRALEKSIQVANSDISVLVTGESGVGKENIPKIIHQYSHRKHAKYIAVNCGAIPEGTIDSELFLDEVGELPLSTQVRLLRILESGEYIKVGSSKVQKTNVRIVAATNVNMEAAIKKGKFREDLFYRLSTIIINIPPLRERKDDIPILFRKFASDFAQKYNMPTLRLDESAQNLLCQQDWKGNIRQLRNIAEQMSILEKERNLKSDILNNYLPNKISELPATLEDVKEDSSSFSSEREILYKVLFDMKNDLNDLNKLTLEIMLGDDNSDIKKKNQGLINKIYGEKESYEDQQIHNRPVDLKIDTEDKLQDNYENAETIEEEETLSLQDKEVEMIKQALIRTNGKRKNAAKELGISERTLYRKIKQHNLGDVSEL